MDPSQSSTPDSGQDAAAPASRAGSGTLFHLLYDELRALAGAQLRQERAGHTLQPTALVHEAYLKIARGATHPWQDEREFYSTAARAMRQILVDHARTRNRVKRGDGNRAVPLSVVDPQSPGASPLDVLALDDAMSRLATMDERKAMLVELRVFAGLGEAEAAQLLGISRSTASEDWRMARAWLSRELRGAGA